MTSIRAIIDLINEFNSSTIAIEILQYDLDFSNALIINERAQIVLNKFTNEKNDILIEDDENNSNDKKTFQADKFLTEAQRFEV